MTPAILGYLDSRPGAATPLLAGPRERLHDTGTRPDEDAALGSGATFSEPRASCSTYLHLSHLC